MFDVFYYKLFNFILFTFRTGLGRARAWLHLALMQKKVADYMKAVLDRKDLLRLVKVITYVDFTPSMMFYSVLCLHVRFTLSLSFFISLFQSFSEFYDSGAFLMDEEGAVMGGLLVGLNVIDANLCIKGEDLDSQVSADRFLWTHSSSHTPRLLYDQGTCFSFSFRWESLTSPFI